MELKNDIKEHTPEWHECRSKRVTGTDFAVIMANKGKCVNVFKKSITALIKSKIIPVDIVDNKYLQAGRDFEQNYLSTMEDVTKGEFLYNDKHCGTVDALDDFCVYELKWTSKTNLEELVSYYKYQLTHYLHLLGREYGKLIVNSQEIIHEFDIYASEVIDKALWINYCDDFLSTLELSKSGLQEDDINLIAEYKKQVDIEKTAKLEQERIKELFIKKYPSGLVTNGFTLSQQKRNSVSYANFIKDNKIEVPEEYTKETTNYIIKLK